MPANQHSSTLATSIKVCHETRFPDLFKQLQIVCTLPVTSCECENKLLMYDNIAYMTESINE